MITLVLVGSLFSLQPVAGEEEVRIGFFSDIHFDRPKQEGTKFGGVEDDRPGVVNYEIPVHAKSVIESIQPDLLFDAGDMTAHSTFHDFRAYQEWKETIDTPIYPVMGNHDRVHNSPHLPYGTGFYSICGYSSATRVLKLGNLVFILISEDHYPELNALDAAISSQKFGWIESQLKKYAEGKNNIFIIEHYPIKNTVAWSDYYYGLGGFHLFGSPGWFDWWWKPWAKMSNQWKDLLRKYEDHVVAHFSGHLHIPYGWKDVPNDREIYDYGDGSHKVENVGQFVSGREINNSTREHPPDQLPEVYFLNIRALDYKHQVAGNFEPESAIYYVDFSQGKERFDLHLVDIVSGKEAGSYKFKTDFPVEIGKGNPSFVSSDLGIRAKDDIVKITEKSWFKVKKSESGWVTFQKAWKEKINVEEVKVLAKGGNHGRIHFKGSQDGGENWNSWTTEPPEKVDVLQVRTCFQADETRDMKVRDVKIVTTRAED